VLVVHKPFGAGKQRSARAGLRVVKSHGPLIGPDGHFSIVKTRRPRFPIGIRGLEVSMTYLDEPRDAQLNDGTGLDTPAATMERRASAA
jgi:hypothetical protein